MKNLNLLFVLLFSFFVYSCQNASNESVNKADNESSQTETDGIDESENQDMNKNENASNESKNLVADFEMLIANTGGTYYRFVDLNGKEWEFYHDESVKALEFAMSLQPGSTDHKYYHKTFELTYEEREITRKNETEILPVITEARELSADEVAKQKSTSANAISVNEIKNTVFFGTEPFWDVQFYDTYVEKGDPSGSKIRFYYVAEGKSGKVKLSEAIKPFAEMGVRIDVTDESEGAVAAIAIVKESCNDGMSENVYPYSFVFEWEDGGGWTGCGRKK